MISEEAIEAAAEWLPHSDDCEVRPERDCTCWHPRLALMRAALEAAAPHIRAEALEDAAAVAADGGVPAYDSDEWAVWLRARAATEKTNP